METGRIRWVIKWAHGARTRSNARGRLPGRPPFLQPLVQPLFYIRLPETEQPTQLDMRNEPFVRPLVDRGLLHAQKFGDFAWREEAVHGRSLVPTERGKPSLELNVSENAFRQESLAVCEQEPILALHHDLVKPTEDRNLTAQGPANARVRLLTLKFCNCGSTGIF